MASFHEVRFPDDIAKGSSGGPERVTDIVELVSGFEERNAAMANSKRTYDAGFGLRNVNDLHDVIEFWEARFGQLYGFRWKDWADYKSCKTANFPAFTDQIIGTGNGTKTQFQLVKSYVSGGYGYSRTIRKPVSGSVLVGKAGVLTTSGWTVDSTTGVVTFSVAPTVGQSITAGFEFDVPVRFDTSSLVVSIDAFNHGSVPDIKIREIRV
jgi:uncharacterized protein (TIGR02217 family)